MKIKDFLSNPKFLSLSQFIKFCLVGVSNTLISYGVDMLCFYKIFASCEFNGLISILSKISISVSAQTLNVIFSSLLAFIISVTNSYLLNNRFVFKSGNSNFFQHLKSYAKTILSYGTTGLILSPIIKTQLLKITINNLKIPYVAAGLSTIFITIPINFLLNKFWAFKPKNE